MHIYSCIQKTYTNTYTMNYLPIYVSIYLCIYLSIYLSIYFSDRPPIKMRQVDVLSPGRGCMLQPRHESQKGSGIPPFGQGRQLGYFMGRSIQKSQRSGVWTVPTARQERVTRPAGQALLLQSPLVLVSGIWSCHQAPCDITSRRRTLPAASGLGTRLG